jgi:hypothetical protein
MLKSDRVVAQVPVEENGVFVIEGLSPGVYSLADVARQYSADGPEGFAAFSVNFVPAAGHR